MASIAQDISTRSFQNDQSAGKKMQELVQATVNEGYSQSASGMNVGSPYKFGNISLKPVEHNTIQPKLNLSEKTDVYEQQADAIAEKITGGANNETFPAENDSEGYTATEHSRTLSLSGNEGASAEKGIAVSHSTGSNMDGSTKAFMESRFGFEFSNIKIHNDEEAAQMNRQLNAKAFTAGNDIYFDQGQYNPATAEGKFLLAHELTHTLQQDNAESIQRKELGDIAASSRTSLRISRLPPDQSKIDHWTQEYFGPGAAATMESEMKSDFGVSITGDRLKKGLRNIGLELKSSSHSITIPASDDEPEHMINTDPSKWELPDNSILDIAIDLRNYGLENAIYRFTSYQEGKEQKLLIERTHVISTPAATVAGPASAAGTFTGMITIKNVTVNIDSSFSEDKAKTIASAVELLPDPIRLKIDGVTFVQVASSGLGPAGQSGEYKEDEDKVRIWGDLFNPTARRVGESGNEIYAVVHELMHAIDLRPMFMPQIKRDEAMRKKKDLEEKIRKASYETTDPLGEDDDNVKAIKAGLRADITTLDKEIADLSKAMGKAKSVSGTELGKNTEALTTGFGKALAADGVKAVPNAKKRNDEKAPGTKAENTLKSGISNYAAVNLMEAFAENFSIYIMDEELLKAIRPKTYAFFVKAFPKTAATP